MPFDIAITGSRDYAQTMKLALCGPPGAGKTLTASTAPSPFFIFLRDQPRIMSIADRYIPHTKIFNHYTPDGRIEQTVWDLFDEVITYLRSDRADGFETVVLDTGDELFQAMKEGRTAQNRGKWAIGDWGWIADQYRARINALIDLHKHVIVTFHLKATQDGEEGAIYQEFALQGAAKDEVGGWFDIIGVLNQFVETTAKGDKVPHRAILFAATPKYPFAKDHSGKLPAIYDVSDNFVGDFEKLTDLVFASVPKSEGEVIEHVELPAEEMAKEPTHAEIGVPTPAEVKQKREAKRATPSKPTSVEAPVEAPKPTEPSPEPVVAGDPPSAEGTTESVEEHETPQPDGGVPEGGAPEPEVPDVDPEEPVAPDPPETMSKAVAEVEKQLGPTTTVAATCDYEVDGATCNRPLVKDKTDAQGKKMADENGEILVVPDQDLIELTMIRFRRHLCKEHFSLMRKG